MHLLPLQRVSLKLPLELIRHHHLLCKLIPDGLTLLAFRFEEKLLMMLHKAKQ